MTPHPAYPRKEEDPGVPEGLGRALEALLERVSVESLATLWLFPPLRNGRRESGLLAAGCYPVGTARSDRRLLVTLAYQAEETGKGVTFRSRFSEEGEAPPERLPVVIEGVVRRADAQAGEPRKVQLAGDEAHVGDLLEALGRPRAPATEGAGTPGAPSASDAPGDAPAPAPGTPFDPREEMTT